MGVVVLRGAIQGEHAANVATEAIAMLLVFTCIGAFAGWTADHLVRDSLERMFRARVEWYRKGLIDAGYMETESPENQQA